MLHLLTLLAASALQAPDEKAYYADEETSWEVYREPKSCALYSKFMSGTIIRFSDRIDESRLYFAALNNAWKMLRPKLGREVAISLLFPHTQRNYSTAAVIIEDGQGNFGFSGGHLMSEEVLRALSSDKPFILMGNIDGEQTEIDRFDGSGAAVAVTHLRECSQTYFRK